MGKGPEEILPQTGNTIEKMLDITNHLGNAAKCHSTS
jgi:hypothetical protein